MKNLMILAAGLALTVSGTAMADGDAAVGEKEFKKCKACHTIKNGDEVLFKGGRTGPNLYGIVGRAAGSEDFKYSNSLIEAGQAGLIWDEDNLEAFITDPKAFLREFTGDSAAKSKMTFKARAKQEDLAAFLASVSPMAEENMEESDDSEDSSEENNDS